MYNFQDRSVMEEIQKKFGKLIGYLPQTKQNSAIEPNTLEARLAEICTTAAALTCEARNITARL